MAALTVAQTAAQTVALMAGLGRGQGLTDLILGTAAINRPR